METGILETGLTARRLKCSPEWVRQLERTGQLPAFAITTTGRRLFREADVEKLRLRREQRKAALG
jgi:DNA-binding transcriptional MerR regulator